MVGCRLVKGLGQVRGKLKVGRGLSECTLGVTDSGPNGVSRGRSRIGGMRDRMCDGDLTKRTSFLDNYSN